MKQKVRLGDCYTLTKYKLKQFKIQYISLLAVITIMCLEARAQEELSDVQKSFGKAFRSSPALSGTSLTDTRPIRIGDVVPNVSIEYILNHPEGSANLDSLSRGLLLLDFGNTLCKPCILSMRYLDSLSKAIGEKEFQVYAVTSERATTVKTFLKRHGYAWPYIVEDKVLKPTLFPHITFPHVVWIRDGVVIAITDSKEAKEPNIRLALEGEKMSLPTKQDLLNYRTQDVVLPTMPDASNIYYSSTLTAYIDGVPGGASVTDRSITYRNNSAVALLQNTLANYTGHRHFRYKNRVLLELDDYKMEKIDPSMETFSQRENRFCYNIVGLPSTDRLDLFKRAFHDLSQLMSMHFDVNINVENRWTECLVLNTHPSIPVSESSGGTYQLNVKAGRITARNAPFSKVFLAIQSAFRNDYLPLIDFTGLDMNVDMDLTLDLNNPMKTNDSLIDYGLILEKEEQCIEMLVITSKDTIPQL